MFLEYREEMVREGDKSRLLKDEDKTAKYQSIRGLDPDILGMWGSVVAIFPTTGSMTLKT